MKSIFCVVAAAALLLASMVVARPQHYSHAFIPNLVATPGYGLPVTPGVVHDTNAADPRQLAHKAVIANAEAEAQLPPELINPFYKDPRIAAGLAKESWFGDKEFPVFNRQADKIPREEIAKIVNRIQHQGR